MAELTNKTPEANAATRDNIVVMEDTFAADLPTAAKAQHLAKMDVEVAAREVRSQLGYHGDVTSPSIKRAKR